MIVFLDSGVLGQIAKASDRTARKNFDITNKCKEWFYKLLSRGIIVATSDICEYEVSRSLILAAMKEPNIERSLQELRELRDNQLIDFLPLNRTTVVS